MSVFTGKWNPGVYLFNQINTENHFGIERHAVGMYVSYIYNYIYAKHLYTCNNCLQTFGRRSKIQYLVANRMFGQRTTGTGKNQTVDLHSLPYWNPSWPWQPSSALSHLSKAFPCEANLLAGQQLSVSCHWSRIAPGSDYEFQLLFWCLDYVALVYFIGGFRLFFFGGGCVLAKNFPVSCRASF